MLKIVCFSAFLCWLFYYGCNLFLSFRSIDRWLVPLPIETSAKKASIPSRLPHQLTRMYLRNNYVFLSFLSVFAAINIGLFVSRAIQYRESNIYVIIARACGKEFYLIFNFSMQFNINFCALCFRPMPKFQLFVCVGVDAAPVHHVSANSRPWCIPAVGQPHLYAQSDRNTHRHFKCRPYHNACDQLFGDCRERSEIELPPLYVGRMDAHYETWIVWFVWRLCKPNWHRFDFGVGNHVHLLTAICSARWQLWNFLLDSFAVHTVLGSRVAAWTKLLEMVLHTVHYLYGGASVEVSTLESFVIINTFNWSESFTESCGFEMDMAKRIYHLVFCCHQK